MNFLAIAQRVRQESGISESGPSLVTGQTGDMKRIVDWCNEAYLRIQSFRRDWNWMWTTSNIVVLSGVSMYSQPASILDIDLETVYLNGKKIPFIDYKDFRERYQSLAHGDATAFSIRPDRKLVLNKTPKANGSIKFEAYLRPAYFTAGTDSPRFGERFHILVAHGALMEYAMYDEAPEIYQKASVSYAQLLAELSEGALPDITAPPSIA